MYGLDRLRILAGVAGLFFLALPALAAQSQIGTSPIVQRDPPQISADSNLRGLDPENRVLAVKRALALNELRQQHVVSDTDRLLKLAKQLSDGIGADGAGMTPEERLRTLAQIEKLAKKVKEQMSYAFDGSPSINSTFPLPAQ